MLYDSDSVGSDLRRRPPTETQQDVPTSPFLLWQWSLLEISPEKCQLQMKNDAELKVIFQSWLACHSRNTKHVAVLCLNM